MIVDLPGTTTNDINKKIIGLREEGGAITLSRVLTLVISLDSDDLLEDSIEAANFASGEPGTAMLVLKRRLPGKRRGSACVKPTRKLRKAKSCARFATVKSVK